MEISNKALMTYNLMPMDKSSQIMWCLSSRKATPALTVKVSLNNGRSYQYLSKFLVEKNSPVIIGGGATEAQMGIADSIETGAQISASKSVRLAYAFKSSCDKNDIKVLAKRLDELDDANSYISKFKGLYFEEGKLIQQYRDGGVEDIYPKQLFVEQILTATSLLAHRDMLSAEKADFCREKLHEPPCLPQELLKCRKFTWLDEPLDYFDSMKYDKSTKVDYINIIGKDAVLTAASIFIRGGFSNLMEAFLSAKPPVDEDIDRLIDFANEISSTKCMQLLMDYRNMHTSVT